MKRRSLASIGLYCLSAASLSLNPVYAAPPEAKLSLAEKLHKIKAAKTESAGTKEATAPAIQNPVYNKVVKGVAYIGVTNEDGNAYQGTGWILDRDQRLLVTNHHVIEGVEDCVVFFPLFEKGQLVADLDRSLIASRAIKAKVVDSDKKYDLALVQVESLPDDAIELALAEQSAAPGQRVHSIAGNTIGSQSLWSYSTGFVRQIVKGELANGGVCMMLESDMATNQGNSGGPVCDDEGRVVAVVEGHATNARLVSMYIDLQALTDYLADGIRCVAPESEEDLRLTAQRHLNEGRPHTALEFASKAVKKNDQQALNLTTRGECWLALDDSASARADFEAALELDTKCSAACAGLAEIAWNEDEYEEALAQYTTAIRNDSENIEHLISRGDLRLYYTDYEEALTDFTLALRKDSTSNDAKRGKAFAQIRLGQYDAGGEALMNLMSHYADDADAHVMLGIALTNVDRAEVAATYFARALELDPEHLEAHSEVGRSLFLQSDFANARPHLEVAIEGWDEDAMINYQYGVTLYALGEPEAAREYLDAALELDPEDKQIQAGVAAIYEAMDE